MTSYASLYDGICNIERARMMALEALSRKDYRRVAELLAAWEWTLDDLKGYFEQRMKDADPERLPHA